MTEITQLNYGTFVFTKTEQGTPFVIHNIRKVRTVRKVFPQGRKPGTSRYWTEGVSLIDRRLKAFEKKYGKFPDSEILDAAKRYVASFQGNYQYMAVLRYFIFKEVVGKAGDLESKSDLLTYLENSGEVDERQDWTAELR